MAFSIDFKWRIVSLMHVYGVDATFLSFVFGPKVRTIRRWYQLFRDTGVVEPSVDPKRMSRWPDEVVTELKNTYTNILHSTSKNYRVFFRKNSRL